MSLYSIQSKQHSSVNTNKHTVGKELTAGYKVSLAGEPTGLHEGLKPLHCFITCIM